MNLTFYHVLRSAKSIRITHYTIVHKNNVKNENYKIVRNWALYTNYIALRFPVVALLRVPVGWP